VGTYDYPPDVLEQLARHGLRPLPTTPPGLLRDVVSDLYRYEIRSLRQRLLAGRIPRREYAAHVVALRVRYPLLSRPMARWTVIADTPADTHGRADGRMTRAR
jgi:hypothetical protein